jgi:hypothetical protein
MKLTLVSGLAGIALIVALTSAPRAASPQAEGFKKLTGPQIRAAFVGKTFTDDTHFSFRYKPDGSVQGMSMGKKVTDKWRLVNDELCVTDKLGETCYAVWRKGSAVRLQIGDGGLSLDGHLK